MTSGETVDPTAGDVGPARSGEKSRRDILDAAARILRRRGYHATTLRTIADAVGIKAGSIYYHFASKDEIIAAVMNDGVDAVHRAVTEALAGLAATASLEERLETAVRAHLHALLEFGDYTSAGLNAYSEAPEPVRDAARPHRLAYEAIWDRLAEEIVAAGATGVGVSARSLKLALLGMMNWSPEWYRPERHRVDDLAREFTALVLSRRG
jgi:AcrR family transcriptional regulator